MTAMQSYRVGPGGKVAGRIRVPGDKSISHRSVMLGGIATGVTEVTGFLASADCLATLNAFRGMGVQVDQLSATTLSIHGRGMHGLLAPTQVLDMGNAGTAIRLSMGLLCGQGFASTLTGDASLRSRPMERVAKPLRAMGADIKTVDGKPPVGIFPVSAMHGIDYAMPVASAQVKSAVLLAGLYAQGTTRVTEPAPTRDHTEHMLRGFGVDVHSASSIVSLRGEQKLQAAKVAVPGDISSAAFFIVAGCMAGVDGLWLENVGVNPTRTGILDILRLMGADIRVHPRGQSGTEPVADIEIRKSQLHGARIPENLVPLAIDELPIAFIAAAAAQGETIVTGAAELRVKESDRLAVMAEGLKQVGVAHELASDGIRIEGGKRLRGGVIDSHGDHRIAMAFTVASLNCDGELLIRDVENVATSFPGFVECARSVGMDVNLA
jgi:3-phosphoshikimate 1-carboxyvinyltransferase